MANITIRRSHAFGLEHARRAVEGVARELEADLKARYRWEGDRLAFECSGAHGHIDVTADAVCVSTTLSWLLAPARGRIERAISDYLDRYLADRSGLR